MKKENHKLRRFFEVISLDESDFIKFLPDSNYEIMIWKDLDPCKDGMKEWEFPNIECWSKFEQLTKDIEKNFFFKNEFFDNKPSLGAIFSRSLAVIVLLVFIICLVSFILPIGFFNMIKSYLGDGENPSNLKILGTFLGAFGAAFAAIYWNLRSDFIQRWNYCALVYNKFSFDSLLSNYNNEFEKKIKNYHIICTLSRDLLALNMFAHESYRYTFFRALTMSFYYDKFIFHSDAKKKLKTLHLKEKIDNEYSDWIKKHTYGTEENSILLFDFDEVNEIVDSLQSAIVDFLLNNNFEIENKNLNVKSSEKVS